MYTVLRSLKFRPIAGLLLALALVAGVSGCASSDSSSDSSGSAQELPSDDPGTDGDALETYVEANRAAAEREMERYRDVYRDFSFEAEGSRTLVYSYTFRNQIDTAQARSQVEQSRGMLRATAETIFVELEGAGIQDPVVKWIYYNADGDEIQTFEFPE